MCGDKSISEKNLELKIKCEPSDVAQMIKLKFSIFSRLKQSFILDNSSLCKECFIEDKYESALELPLNQMPEVLKKPQILIENKDGQKFFFNQLVEGEKYQLMDYHYDETSLIDTLFLNEGQTIDLFSEDFKLSELTGNSRKGSIRMHYIDVISKSVISSNWVQLPQCINE